MILSNATIYGVQSQPNKVTVNGESDNFNYNYDVKFNVRIIINNYLQYD